jgi:hypothetical protein
VMLPRGKIDSRVVEDLQLAPLEESPDSEQLVAFAEAPVTQGIEDVPAISSDEAYDSIRLVDRILHENRTSLELSDLRVKAQAEAEET